MSRKSVQTKVRIVPNTAGARVVWTTRTGEIRDSAVLWFEVAVEQTSYGEESEELVLPREIPVVADAGEIRPLVGTRWGVYSTLDPSAQEGLAKARLEG